MKRPSKRLKSVGLPAISGNQVKVGAFIIAFAVIGTLFLRMGRAATGTRSFESESGSLNNAAKVTAPGVSAGGYVSLGGSGGSGGWKMLAMRSQEEFQAGEPGGEGWQHPQGITRSVSNPDVLYISHDCGQVWRSRDSGRSWQRTIGAGMKVIAANSIAVDKNDPNIVIAEVDDSFDWMGASYTGLYRSTDGGDNWTHVLHVDTDHDRRYSNNIAYDPTQPNRWYAAFGSNGLYRSVNGGVNWDKVANLGASEIYGTAVSPADGRVYVATNAGLFRSPAGGEGLSPVGAASGDVSGLAIDQTNPSVVYIVQNSSTLLKSTNGGESFSVMHSMGNARYVFVNPAHANTMWLVSSSEAAIVSTNGGASWEGTSTATRNSLGRGWMNMIGGFEQTGISPDPRSSTGAVAFSRSLLWRTSNGRDWDYSAAGYGGANLVGSDGMDWDPTNEDRLAIWAFDFGFAATQNGGDWWQTGPVPSEWIPNTVKWYDMQSGDMQPGTNTVLAAVGDVFNGRIIRSTDLGQNWSVVDGAEESYKYMDFHPNDPNLVFAGQKKSTNGGQSFQSVPALVSAGAEYAGYHENNPDIMYAIGQNNILRSTDRGSSWSTYVTAGWNLGKHDSFPTFYVDPNDPNKVYSIDSSGDLAAYNGSSWRSFGVLPKAGGSEVGNFVRSVVVDPNDSNIIYAGMWRPGVPMIWRSTDGGNSWTDVSGNVPRIGAWKMEIHPSSGEVITSSCCGMYVLSPPYQAQPKLYSKAIPIE